MKLSEWVQTSLMHENRQIRVQRAQFFLEVLGECARLRNFFAVMSINSAFQSAPVFRLKAWEVFIFDLIKSNYLVNMLS